MAVVKFPALSFEASGNVGDINYTTWRGRAVVRATFTFSDPNTSAQQQVRAKLTTLSQAWGQTLTAAERETWHERAAVERFPDRFGELRNPTGYNLFIKWNMILLQIGVGMNKSALAGILNTRPSELSVQDKVTNGRITVNLKSFANITPDAIARAYYLAGPYDSQGRRPIKPEYRFAGFSTGAGAFQINGLTLTKWYWAKGYAILASGQTSNTFEEQIDQAVT